MTWSVSPATIPRPPVPSWFVTPPSPAEPAEPVTSWWAKPTSNLHADATVTINATASASAGARAKAVAAPVAPAESGAGVLGPSTLLGEETSFRAAVESLADAVANILGTGEAASGEPVDTGFPYTFPFVFGGQVLTAGSETNAPATMTITATAEAAAGVMAEADLPIVAFPDTQTFPYTFPFTLS